MTSSVRTKLSCCCPPRWWTLLGSISGWARIWPESTSRARKRRRLDRERTCDRCAPPLPEEEEVCCCCSSFLAVRRCPRAGRGGSCGEREVGLAHSLAQRVARAGVPASGALRSQQRVRCSRASGPVDLPSCVRVQVESSRACKPTQTVLRSVVALRAAPICARLEYDGALCLRASSAWRTSRRCKTARERFPKSSRRLDSRLDSIHSCSI